MGTMKDVSLVRIVLQLIVAGKPPNEAARNFEERVDRRGNVDQQTTVWTQSREAVSHVHASYGTP